MLNKLKKSKSEGFTIIEVMIVLAIAGLILLIVLLAVPALQRNSRNTQRKNDVSALIAAVNEYTSNNNGTLPTTAAEVLALSKPGYYTGGSGTGQGQVNLVAGAQGALGGKSADDRIVISTGTQCGVASAAGPGGNPPAVVAGSTVPGNARQVSVQYEVENSGTWTATCQSS